MEVKETLGWPIGVLSNIPAKGLYSCAKAAADYGPSVSCDPEDLETYSCGENDSPCSSPSYFVEMAEAGQLSERQVNEEGNGASQKIVQFQESTERNEERTDKAREDELLRTNFLLGLQEEVLFSREIKWADPPDSCLRAQVADWFVLPQVMSPTLAL